MHLLKITDLDVHQINDIFELADKLKQKPYQKVLSNKTFVLFFPESSIRTRITFEKGIMDLGGNCILFPPATLDKREKHEDVIKYIENWCDGVIVRYSKIDAIKEMANHASIPVINAMTAENHPCEILTDLYGFSRMRSNYLDLTYTFVGEHANISKSWMRAAKVLDFKLNHVSTTGNEMKKNDNNYAFFTNLDMVLPETDIVLTDPLPKELRVAEYLDAYQITSERMETTKENALLNPCPPFFRDEEVSRDVIDSKYFVGHAFKKNLIYVQQAIILYCLGIQLGGE